jgi:serine/threonine-protein phosphatase 4 regulatory subunit 1
MLTLANRLNMSFLCSADFQWTKVSPSSTQLTIDDTVKEAFASELHRVLWYFFSRCKLVQEGEEVEDVEMLQEASYILGEEDGSVDDSVLPGNTTYTVTSEGVDAVQHLASERLDANAIEVPATVGRRSSAVSLGGPSTSSTSSSLTQPSSTLFSAPDIEVDTPGSTVSNTSSHDTAFSPGAFINPFSEDHDPEKGWAKDIGPLMAQPTLAVGFFTPLLGSLLLSNNPAVCDPVRNGVVSIIGRLRRKGPTPSDSWGPNVDLPEPDERRTFASQTGPHSHDLRPFTDTARVMVEAELLAGIVVGMGRLSVDMPEALFDEADDEADEDLEAQREAFQAQLMHEATVGQATSMNLIGAICEFYSPVEAVDKGFVDELLRAGEGDVPVRAEAAIAMSYLAKVVPDDYIHAMVSALIDRTDDRSLFSSNL